MARIVDRKAKRLLLVEAAAAQFARNGYDATGMDDVAAAAGVSKGSLYDYFKNKEDLFYAVFEWCDHQTMLASLAEMKTHGSATEQMIGFAEAAVSALTARVELYPVTLEIWSAAAKAGTRKRFSKAMRALYVRYREQVEMLLRFAQANGEIKADTDIPAVAGLLVGAVDGLMLQYWLDRSIDPKSWMRSFLSALFEGLSIKTAKG